MLNHPNIKEAKTTVENITKSALSEEQYNLAVADNLIADNNTWQWWLNKGMNHSLQDLVKNLEIPVTILTSEDDPVMTPQIIRDRVLNVFPDATLITTNNIGHLIPMEDPSWVANQLRNLLSQ